MCGTLVAVSTAAADEYADLVVNRGDPHPQTPLRPVRRARVSTRTYGGVDVVVELDVVATSPGFVCVRQPREGREPWNAWIPARDAVPV